MPSTTSSATVPAIGTARRNRVPRAISPCSRPTQRVNGRSTSRGDSPHSAVTARSIRLSSDFGTGGAEHASLNSRSSSESSSVSTPVTVSASAAEAATVTDAATV
ncbi:hypothetical protein GC176_06190 [bacterium]|nr:hypothetical protein [bacterium]